jgi:hypothetical protein
LQPIKRQRKRVIVALKSVIMKKNVKRTILALAIGLAMMVIGVHGATLLAGSKCISMPVADNIIGCGPLLDVTSESDSQIEVIVLSREEQRVVINTGIVSTKVYCRNLADEYGQVAFQVKGINRYFTTSPANIVD